MTEPKLVRLTTPDKQSPPQQQAAMTERDCFAPSDRALLAFFLKPIRVDLRKLATITVKTMV